MENTGKNPLGGGLAGLHQVDNEVNLYPINSTHQVSTQEEKSTCPHKSLNLSVHRSITQSRQSENKHPLADERMNKLGHISTAGHDSAMKSNEALYMLYCVG